MVEIFVETAGLRLGHGSPQVLLDQTPPLFVVGKGSNSALDTLMAELRLSGVPAKSDANSIVQRALLDARLSFLRKLGDKRVAHLSSIVHVNNPITTDQTLRAVAASTEVLLVRRALLRTLRTTFADGNSARDMFNDEGFVRDAPEIELSKEISALHAEIEENFELLSGEEAVGQETQGMLVSTINPVKTPPLPGASIWPGLR